MGNKSYAWVRSVRVVRFLVPSNSMTLKHSVLALFITVGIACTSPTAGCACSPLPTYSRYVAGFVRDNTGAPINATVRVFLYDRYCSGMARDMGDLSVAGLQVDGVGHYAFSLSRMVLDTLCMRLVAKSMQIIRDGPRN